MGREVLPFHINYQLREEQAATMTVESDRGSGGGEGPHSPDGGGRIGRLEGAVEGLRHSQNMILGSVGIVAALVAVVAAFVVGFGVYELQRIDSLNDKVNALPGQITGEIRDLTKTLADTITAARQPAPPPERKR
jgi:hypothetical protein